MFSSGCGSGNWSKGLEVLPEIEPQEDTLGAMENAWVCYEDVSNPATPEVWKSTTNIHKARDVEERALARPSQSLGLQSPEKEDGTTTSGHGLGLGIITQEANMDTTQAHVNDVSSGTIDDRLLITFEAIMGGLHQHRRYKNFLDPYSPQPDLDCNPQSFT
ncbi:hypothetical protein OEA41_009280 [Lepraria neglecta]|uniref:Uncharacterized protein n=1 Tax=Lepraria neglecta TaxID=209136 RepID=A0AAD9Z2W2_9LECA|nr:hypothetical protein OEA41_009280 [Lepraria neglecta]